jgi:hypothetical protein
MKRTLLPVVMLMAVSISLGTIIGASSDAKDPITVMTDKPAAAAPIVETVQLTPIGDLGNWRHPGVAEDSKGNRLVIFRGPEGTKYYYVYCLKNGTWSAPAAINNGVQPSLVGSLYSYIEVDSSDRFHCQWENANAAVYASFRDGVWTSPMKVAIRGKYDQTSGMTVDSQDRVVSVACGVVGWDKELWITRKGTNDANFSTPFNISRDGNVASTQPCVAVDSMDNAWVVWKSDHIYGGMEENLVIYLAQFDGNTNADIGDWITVSTDPGWSFLPQVAVNSEDKIMTLCSTSTWGDYVSTFYDPATKQLSRLIPLNVGLVMAPWHTFFSRMVAHGKDFYAAVMDPGRTLWLMKFDQMNAKWERVAAVSHRGVEQFAMYSGYDHLLIAYNSKEEPTSVSLTTVSVDPFSKVKIKSASNLNVVKKIERTFFHAYYLNALTWSANPENTAKSITITAHRIYRKIRTEDDSKWTRISEVAGTVFGYIDRNVPADSDYVYTVTCVDDRERESKVF